MKVKAHRLPEHVVCELERYRCLGNKVANDETINACIDLHKPIVAEDLIRHAVVTQARRDLSHWYRFITDFEFGKS